SLRSIELPYTRDVRHVQRKYNAVLRRVLDPRLRIAVLLAHLLRGDQAIAKTCSERRDCGLHGALVVPAGHGVSCGRRRPMLPTNEDSFGTSASRNGIGRHRSITMMPSRAIR